MTTHSPDATRDALVAAHMTEVAETMAALDPAWGITDFTGIEPASDRRREVMLLADLEWTELGPARLGFGPFVSGRRTQVCLARSGRRDQGNESEARRPSPATTESGRELASHARSRQRNSATSGWAAASVGAARIRRDRSAVKAA